MLIIFWFIGLTAFVHDDQGLHALLVNTDSWQTSDRMPLPEHTAFVAEARLLTGSAAADCPDEAQRGGCSWLLDHEDITVEGDVQGVNLNLAALEEVVAGRAAGLESVLTPKGQQVESGIASVDLVKIPDIVPETLAVKGHCLDPKPDRDLLIGRFTLGVGNLVAFDVCNAPVDFNRIVSPAPQASGRRAHIGDIALVAVKSTDAVTLRLKKFGSLGAGRTITLKPPGVVFVLIANIDENATARPCSDGKPESDSHFEAYYRLAAREPWLYGRLVPFACCASPQKHLLDILKPLSIGQRIICPMAAF